MLGGRQVLVHGPAVRDEAQAQLEVSGQTAVRGQRQDQQRGDQKEAHHQQSHAAAVSQQVGAVGGRAVGANLQTKIRKTAVRGLVEVQHCAKGSFSFTALN